MHGSHAALASLLLATSCLPRTTTLLLEPTPATAGVGDTQASALAMLDRVTARHALVPTDKASPGCRQAWHRQVARSSRFGPPSAELTVCASYAASGVLEVRVVEAVVPPRHWSATADSLRHELADSLGALGQVAVREQ